MKNRIAFALLMLHVAACAEDTTDAKQSSKSDVNASDAGTYTLPDGAAWVDPSLTGFSNVRGGTPGYTVPAGSITYYKHAKPIIDAKCVRCHVAGTVAPFALDNYEQAKTFSKVGMDAINAGKMPPWKFQPGCNDYIGDYSLTTDEKALLQAWVDGGALEGDPSDVAAPLDIHDTKLSRVDVTLTIPEPYVPSEHPDHYRCFPVPWPKDKTAFMTGFHPIPGNPKIVHHIEVYHVPASQAASVQKLDDADPGPGYTCFGGPGVGTGTIGGWAPGGPGYDYPDGVGIQIDPGAVIIVQVHYNTYDTAPEPDQTKVELKVDEQAIRGGYNFWTNILWSELHQMPISAGDPDKKYTWGLDPTILNGGAPIVLYQAALHMHNIGRTGYIKVRPRNSNDVCVLNIGDWDFHWQGGVRLQKPILINPGDQVEIQCGYDNSAAHQAAGPDGNLNTPRDMNWGENTGDEMCLGVLLWGPQQNK